MIEKAYPWIAMYLLLAIFYKIEPEPLPTVWPVLAAVGSMMAISFLRIIRGK